MAVDVKRARQRVRIAMLLAGAMTVAGCSSTDTMLAVILITAPITIPLEAIHDVTSNLGRKAELNSPTLKVSSSTAGSVVETRRVALPSQDEAKVESIYPDGAGKFHVLYRQPKLNSFLMDVAFDASDSRFHDPRTLPENFDPVGMQAGALVAVSKDKSRLMVVEHGAAAARVFTLPVRGCRRFIPSSHTRFAACETSTGVVAINLETRQPAAAIQFPPASQSDIAVTDDGHLLASACVGVFGSGKEALYYSPAGQPGSVASFPQCANNPFLVAYGARTLFASAGNPSLEPSQPQVSAADTTVIDPQSGAVLFTVPNAGFAEAVFAAPNGRMAFVGNRDTVVLIPGRSANAVTNISLSGAAAWDEAGEWLLLMRPNGRGALVRFKPLDAAPQTHAMD